MLNYSLIKPAHWALRVSQRLNLQWIAVSSVGARSVWSRHELLSKHQLLLRLEGYHRERRIELTANQIKLPEFRVYLLN